MSTKNIALSALGAVVALGMNSLVLADTAAPNKMMQDKTMENLTHDMPGGFEKCYGVAKAGKNDCASGANACAGQSKADNDKSAWIGLPKGTCDRIVGGVTSASNNAS